MRIASFLPSATEILFALGAGDEVVGVTHRCDYPPEAREKPFLTGRALPVDDTNSAAIDAAVAERKAGGMSAFLIDEEALLRAAPDLIITQEVCDVCAADRPSVYRAAGRLAREHRFLVLRAACLEDVYANIVAVGEACGRPAEAEETVEDMQRRVSAVAEGRPHPNPFGRLRAGSLPKGEGITPPRPRVLCLEWTQPLRAAGLWIAELVELAGGDHPYNRPGAPSRVLDWDEVLALPPEVVLVAPCGFEAERAEAELAALQTLPGWHDLPAVASGRVHALDGALLARHGPRLADALETLAALLHPATTVAGTHSALAAGPTPTPPPDAAAEARGAPSIHPVLRSLLRRTR